MASITVKDLFVLVVDERMSPDDAMVKAQKLGLDHNELGLLLDIPQPEAIKEDEQPKTRRVTAKAAEFQLPDGRKLPYLFAGRHRWTRKPGDTSTHELCQSQYVDVKRHETRGSLVIVKDEPIAQRQVKPKDESQKR